MTLTFEFSQSQGVCMLSLKGVESRMWNIPSLDLDLVFVYNNNLVHTGVISMHASEVLVWICFEVLDLNKNITVVIKCFTMLNTYIKYM